MAGRREAQRLESIAEIKRLARAQLVEHGAEQLSLRAIARDLGVVSSAVYRYFSSRDELLTALLIDAYDDLGGHIERADASVRRRDNLLARWKAIALAMRSWALEHPADYTLLFGTPIRGYAAPVDTIGPAGRYTDVMMQLLADIHSAGIRHTAAMPRSLHANLRRLTARLDLTIDDTTMLVGMAAWATVHGAINLELFGHLHNVIEDTDSWYGAIAEAAGRQVIPQRQDAQ